MPYDHYQDDMLCTACRSLSRLLLGSKVRKSVLAETLRLLAYQARKPCTAVSQRHERQP